MSKTTFPTLTLHCPSPNFLYMFSFLFCSLHLLVISQSSPSKQLLLNIKEQWHNQPPMDSWSSTTPFCQWPGLNCTGGENVTGISFNSQNIYGEIPSSICELRNLTLLDLGNNSITGNFPTFLYNCTKLQTLVLSLNYFVGTLPNNINKLSLNLQHIDLSVNNFTGNIPTSLAQLKGLITLHLDSNLFNGTFPSQLGNLESLEELVLAYNPFAPMNLPKEFGMLRKLKFLWMTQCNLIGEIPIEFADLANLKHLDLVDNSLVGGIPSGLFLLKKLTRLYLYKNWLSGGLPTSIEALNLVELDVSQNNLRGIIPQDIGKLQKLEIIKLFENEFHGTIPPSIALLPNLTTVRLFTNRFSGPLPPEMGRHSKLAYFEVANNAFTGQLPENLCFGGELLGVVAFDNYLNGTLPSSLGQCNAMLAVKVYNNSFSGEVPEGIWTLPHMMILQLSNNKFSGQLPAKMAVNVSVVELSNNRFSGELPSEIISWRSLNRLNLTHNQLSGLIPSELASLPVLTLLDLSNNYFSGNLPSLLPTNLVWLDISNNKISGPIPSSIFNCRNLVVLQASNNQLWGNIPEELTDLSFLYSLLLDGNQLSGELPSRIISWKSLNTLNLSRNNLSGQLPSALGSLPHLQYLDMSHNKLSGQVPPELTQQVPLENLITLNLSCNNLRGKIPHEFDNKAFDLSFLDNANMCSDKQISNLPRCSTPRQSQRHYLAVILGFLVPGATIFLITLYFTFFRVNKGRKEEPSCEKQAWELKSFHRVDFTEANILYGLTDNNRIGSGGSGKVYMIIVNDSGDRVAVKRIWNGKKLEGALEKQFLTEVEFLGTFRHANIVKLLCCVSSSQEKLLVYEYMENQSLDKWLQRKRRANEPSSVNSETSMSSQGVNNVLDWPSRLRIAIGAAKGLCYLHNDCSPPIIHRDVKSSNILLDTEFNAKIADFGLAKMIVQTGEPHTASAIAGSFGYIAPEYWRTKKLNEKIDVYSFGVVLLELATGKHPCKGNNHLNLADWSWKHYGEEHPITDVLDEDIKEPSFMKQMENVFKLGLMCTSQTPASRPTMKQVLQLLLTWSRQEERGQTQSVNEE